MLDVVSKENFASKCALDILDKIQFFLRNNGTCNILLAGGNTPRSVYEKIIELQADFNIDWARCVFFIGDERYVPYDDPQNNGKMADEALLQPLNIHPSQRIFINTDLPLVDAANNYSDRLIATPDLVKNGFQIVLLGLGADGHTLSLFPGKFTFSDLNELVWGYFVDTQRGSRITLTPLIINRSAYVLFMVSGAAKSKAVYQVAQNELALASEFPAKLINPGFDKLHFIVDEEAASMLDTCG